MSLFNLRIFVTMLVFVGLTSAASAGGEFLDGCLALKGNEQLFKKTTVKWEAEQRGETVIAYATINVEGKATVCGMHMNKGAVPQAELRRMLSKSEIKSGKQTMVRNLSYFTNACNEVGCKLCAPCYMTTLNWKPAYARPKFVPGVDDPAQ
ncbi:hypothetical protein [Aestuariivita boseongensis]|uniref:hypothetical protein n=1 Tax=Aestuariivita boseongensis TaxID=1470562 RepID=UPI0012F72812|nr:hypothetical protein [Aestuariivita boseongensis]